MRLVLIAAIVAGVSVLGWRGVYRAVAPPQPHGGMHWDFGLVYSLSRAWIIGANPYEMEGVSRAWASSNGDPDGDPALRRSAGILVYPPTTLATLSPLASLPYRIAAPVWMLANLAAIALFLGIAARMLSLTGLPRLAFWACGIWLAPTVTGIAVGQTAVITMGLLSLGLWFRARRGTDGLSAGSWMSGVLLGLATAIKPQMGLLFIVYEAGRQRWRPVVAAAAVLVVVASIGIGRLQAAGVPWLQSWQQNLHDFPRLEDGDPTRHNMVTRHHMVNLHYPLHNFTDDRTLVTVLVYGVAGALSLAYFVVDLRRRRHFGEGSPEPVSIAMAATVCLFVVYHRFYDAVLLAWPIALAIRMIADRRYPALAWTLLGLCALFFVPGAVILAAAAAKGWVPAELTNSALWQNVLLPHEAWALPVIAALLVAIRARWVPFTQRPT